MDVQDRFTAERGSHMPYIFRKGQHVKWSKDAFVKEGKQWFRMNYGLGAFIVARTMPVCEHDRELIGHQQLVTVKCNGKCLIPLMNSAKEKGKCNGNCHVTFSGLYFKPFPMTRKKKRKKK